MGDKKRAMEKASKPRDTHKFILESFANFVIPGFLQPPLFPIMMIFGALQTESLHGSSIVLLLIANITLLAEFKPAFVDYQLKWMISIVVMQLFFRYCSIAWKKIMEWI